MSEAQQTEVVFRDSTYNAILDCVEMLQGHFCIIDRDPILKDAFQSLVDYLYSQLDLDGYDVQAEKTAFWVSPAKG